MSGGVAGLIGWGLGQEFGVCVGLGIRSADELLRKKMSEAREIEITVRGTPFQGRS